MMKYLIFIAVCNIMHETVIIKWYQKRKPQDKGKGK